MPPYSVLRRVAGLAWREAQPLTQVPKPEATWRAVAPTPAGAYWWASSSPASTLCRL